MNYITHKILLNEKIVVEYLKGEFTPDNISDFKLSLNNDILLQSNISILIDIRDAHLGAKKNDIRTLIECFDFHKLIPISGKIIFLTNSPNQVAGAMLFRIAFYGHEKDVLIFSTLEAALENLGIYDKKERIKKCLKELKTKLFMLSTIECSTAKGV